MCKDPKCKNNDCIWCLRRADAKTRKPLKRTEIKKSGKPIRREAKKRAVQQRKYRVEVAKWKLINDKCKARLEGCTEHTEHCHHMWGKENELLLIKRFWLPVCSPCHDKIGVMPIDEAIAMGLSLRRNVSIEQRKAE